MNLEDLEAYLKIANYSITKLRFDYKRYPESRDPFVVRDDLLLENIVAEQMLIAAKARAASAQSSVSPESKERERIPEKRGGGDDADRAREIAGRLRRTLIIRKRMFLAILNWSHTG